MALNRYPISDHAVYTCKTCCIQSNLCIVCYCSSGMAGCVPGAGSRLSGSLLWPHAQAVSGVCHAITLGKDISLLHAAQASTTADAGGIYPVGIQDIITSTHLVSYCVAVIA